MLLLMQMLSNIRLLAASRTEAMSLQLSGSEALGTELTLKGQAGMLRGLLGYLDDAAMTLTRWWDITYAAAGRQDSLDVVLGVGRGVSPGRTSGSRKGDREEVRGAGGSRSRVRSLEKGEKVVEEEGQRGKGEGEGTEEWYVQPRRRVRLLLAVTQLVMMIMQLAGLLLGLVKQATMGGDAGAGKIWALGNASWDVAQLAQLIFPGVVAAGLFGYVVRRARWYVSWPQVALEELGIQPPWGGGPEAADSSVLEEVAATNVGKGARGMDDGSRKKKQ
jgi:hypothetical protein